MDIEAFRAYCLAKKGVTEEFPFDENTLVFKVMGKMFAATGLTGEFRVNLKGEPARNEELRDEYDAIEPGYHMNKKHWNTVYFEDGTIPDDFLRELTDQSYDLVVSGMTKKLKAALDEL